MRLYTRTGKRFLVMVVGMLVFGSGYAQHRVELTIKGIENAQGSVLVAVYNSEVSFMKRHVASKKVKVTGKEVSLVFENVAPGDYAISTFHDENDNNKLDTNLLGIPNERYGFSNDARGTFGPPSFEKARIKVDGDKKVVINLK
ncbi:MAG TPA: DUF2141 domain-containing protein [Cyclobacteriaceae bacterium]|nr:DUF2141 domain-containing protein [Cyclobacteriaceae bacterium]